MAKKQVIWTNRAQQDRIKILEYWIERNKSKTYSEKLLDLFIEAADLIAEHPGIGKPTNYKNIRFKIVRDYLLFYENLEDDVHILFIWDSRQNPIKLKKQFKEK